MREAPPLPPALLQASGRLLPSQAAPQCALASLSASGWLQASALVWPLPVAQPPVSQPAWEQQQPGLELQRAQLMLGSCLQLPGHLPGEWPGGRGLPECRLPGMTPPRQQRQERSWGTLVALRAPSLLMLRLGRLPTLAGLHTRVAAVSRT